MQPLDPMDTQSSPRIGQAAPSKPDTSPWAGVSSYGSSTSKPTSFNQPASMTVKQPKKQEPQQQPLPKQKQQKPLGTGQQSYQDTDDDDPVVSSYKAWQSDQSPQNLKKVTDSLEHTIDSAIRSYAQNYDSPVLRSRARLLAAKAIRSYDPDRGVSLKTHVMNQLQELQRIAPTISDPMPKPERLRRESAQLNAAQVELGDKLGREPTDDELADYLNYDVKKVKSIKRRNRAVVSESALMPDDNDDDEGEFLPGVDREDPINLWASYLYHDLDERDKLIFKYRTGWDNSPVLTNKEIAQKLGISEAAVSKRATRIESRLKEFVDEMEKSNGNSQQNSAGFLGKPSTGAAFAGYSW